MDPGRIWGKVNWTGSTSFQKGFFKKIAEKGPITLYELSNKSNPKNPPYTSVTRILERWEELLWIAVFDKKKLRNGNIRKTYIPTVTGVIHFFAPKLKVTNDLKSQFEKWGKEPKFYIGYGQLNMTDEYTKNPKKTIKNILLSTSFTDNADKECDKPIPQELRPVIGAIIFQYNNKKLYDKQYNELYNDFEPFRTTMDGMYSKLDTARRQLKEDVSELESNPTNQANFYLREFAPMFTHKDMEKIVKTGREPDFHLEFLYRHEGHNTAQGDRFEKVILSKNLDKVINMQALWRDNESITLQPYFDPESDEVEDREDPNITAQISGYPTRKFLSLSDVKFAMAFFTKDISQYEMAQPLTFEIHYLDETQQHRSMTPGGNVEFFDLEESKKFEGKYDNVKFVSISISLNDYIEPRTHEAQEFFDKFEIFVPALEDAPSKDEAYEDVRENLVDESVGIYPGHAPAWLTVDNFRVEELHNEMLNDFIDAQRNDAEKRWAEKRKKAKK